MLEEIKELPRLAPLHGSLAQGRPDPNTITIFHDWTRFTSDDHGRISGQALQGLYCAETLMLSRHSFKINSQPVSHGLGMQLSGSQWAMTGLINGTGSEGNLPGGRLPKGCIDVTILREVDHGFTELVTIQNHDAKKTRKIKIELELVAPMLDTEFDEEMKKDRREPRCGVKPEVSQLRQEELNLVFLKTFGRRRRTPVSELKRTYLHDGPRNGQIVRRGFKLHCRKTRGKASCRFTAKAGRRTRVLAATQLGPGEQIEICFCYDMIVDSKMLKAPRKIHIEPLPTKKAGVPSSYPHVRSNNATFDLVMSQAVSDFSALKLSILGQKRKSLEGIIAGVPRYVGVFARDTLIAGWQAVMFEPHALKTFISRIGALQGLKFDPWRDEEPDRLPHERRMNPLSALGELNRELYYGDVTSTPFFCIALASYMAWTGDKKFLRAQKHALEHCCDWILRRLDEGRGFIYYQPAVAPNKGSNRNQAWKDSGDAIVGDDGRIVLPPLALIEIQGYCHRALLDAADLIESLGKLKRAQTLRAAAEKLKKNFNEKFWRQDQAYYVLALKKDFSQVKSKASNIGHCLGTGIIDSSRVTRVTEFLLAREMFSGWGVRTLSADNPAFDPYAYHRGTVWPVENAEIVNGLSLEGRHEAASHIVAAQLAVATFFQHFRLPEVISGHERSKRNPIPGLYPYANLLQAWSVTAMMQFLQAMLGIRPECRLGTVFLQPCLPEWLSEVTVRDLKFGMGVLSLHFYRHKDGRTLYRVLSKSGRFNIKRGLPPRYRHDKSPALLH